MLKPQEPQSRGWYQEAEIYLMELRFTHSLRMCVFLEQRNSDERSTSHIENHLLFFKEGKQKIFYPL